MIQKIVVANRGEIAARIFRACRSLGVQSVAIFSEADAGAPWVRLADEAYPLVGAAAAQTYLNQTAILNIACQSGADALHPGFGFLSENATFAQACLEAGLIFIGPSAEAMRLMGSKASARELAQRVGVPVIPGVDGAGKSEAELAAAAADIGYPVLIKASAGGGGKGMRVVGLADELAGALQAARREAQSSFGDDHILIEKYFTAIRHIEVQVLGDTQGNLLHLFERECSIQRRHQKIVEESPAPQLPDEVRQKICAAAVALAQAVDYVSAGTVEFILAPDNSFYLLEMNTRLQVEHPITELVTGLDIASWQIRIASGEALPFAQGDIRQRGHAIECRVYAEDPAQNFLPSIGKISWYKRPLGPGIRVDDGIETGSMVTPYYDPMLAKIITWGADRQEARRKMLQALDETVILGVTTNIPYLQAILQHEAFVAGRTTTTFLEEHLAGWQRPPDLSDDVWLALAAAEVLGKKGKVRGAAADSSNDSQTDPWNLMTNWRNVS